MNWQKIYFRIIDGKLDLFGDGSEELREHLLKKKRLVSIPKRKIEKVIGTCPVCGKPIRIRSRRAKKFCSRKCYMKNYRAIQKND